MALWHKNSGLQFLKMLCYSSSVKHLKKKLLKVNFDPVKREFLWWLGCGVFFLSIGKLLDFSVFGVLRGAWRTPFLDEMIVFLTERLIWVILISFAIVTAIRVVQNADHRSKLVPASFSVFFVGILSFILKEFFNVPRPYQLPSLGVEPLVAVSSPSFPSAHTATAFALLIPFFRISRLLGVLWAVFAILIGFSRVYENVH